MNYIFDFDGTLMDTSAVILATIEATIREMNLPPRTEQQKRAIIGIRTDEAGQHLYPGLDISNAEFARTFRASYDRIKRDAKEKTFDGVLPTLESIAASGSRMAIASSRRLDSLNAYLSGLGIADRFDMIVGADSVSKGKPDPEPVLTILNALGWCAADTIVVGDADVDILMGRGAGCITCAVSYGNGSAESLATAKPTYIIDAFPELLTLPCVSGR